MGGEEVRKMEDRSKGGQGGLMETHERAARTVSEWRQLVQEIHSFIHSAKIS